MESVIQLMREEMLKPVKEIEAKMNTEMEKKISKAIKNTEAKNKIMEDMVKLLNNKS